MKNFKLLVFIGILISINCMYGIAFAQNEKDSFNIAIFDFEIKDSALKNMKGKITPLLTGLLSSSSDFKIVERTRLEDLLKEMELGKAGIVTNGTAAKVGKLAGAGAIIVGKVFALDDEIIITSKLISVESSIVFSNVVRGTSKDKMSELIMRLSDKISSTIEKEKEKLIILPDKKVDTIKEIKKAIKGKKLPVISIAVRERHIGEAAIDPASETELKYYFNKTGFKIIDSANKELRTWVKQYIDDSQTPLLSQFKKIDVIIVGEAFSEFAIRKNNLVVCKARIEIQAIDTKTHELLLVDRITESAIDLSTQIAGKTAIQEGTAKIAKRLIPELVKKWNKK